jgi:hypothetical protein
VATLGGRRLHSIEVEMAVREWSRLQGPDFHRDRILKLVLRWDKSINVLGVYAETVE